MPLLLIAGALALGSIGYAADKTGEGINDAGNGLVKLAIGGAVAYYIYKKVK